MAQRDTSLLHTDANCEKYNNRVPRAGFVCLIRPYSTHPVSVMNDDVFVYVTSKDWARSLLA